MDANAISEDFKSFAGKHFASGAIEKEAIMEAAVNTPVDARGIAIDLSASVLSNDKE